MKRRTSLATMGGAALLAAAALTLGSQEVTAADHADGDVAAADGAADITDFYVWNTATDGSGNIVMVLGYSGLLAPGDDAVYDPDVLYQFHIDTSPTNNNHSDDLTINVRFGQNGLGEWGVQFEDVPGADDASFNGAVATTLTSGDVSAHAGLFDDPFFFDLDAFITTLANTADDTEAADLAFTPGEAEDFFAGTNVMAIVVEFPSSALGDEIDSFSAWVSTGRITEEEEE
jgi:hypothetical protein